MHESESVKIVCVKYFDIFTASTLNLNLVPTLPTKELTCFCEIEDNSVAAALCTLYSTYTYIYIGTVCRSNDECISSEAGPHSS